jgi:hypothetical protein
MSQQGGGQGTLSQEAPHEVPENDDMEFGVEYEIEEE